MQTVRVRMELYNTDTKPNMETEQRDKQSTTTTNFRCSRLNSTSTKKILFLSNYQSMFFIITFVTLFLISGIESTTSTTTTSRPTTTNNANIGGKDKAKPAGIFLDTLTTTTLTPDDVDIISSKKSNKGDDEISGNDNNHRSTSKDNTDGKDKDIAKPTGILLDTLTTTTLTPDDIDRISSKSNKGDDHNDNDNNNVLISKRNGAGIILDTPDIDKKEEDNGIKSNKGNEHNDDNDDDNDNVMRKRNVPDDDHTPNSNPNESTTPTTTFTPDADKRNNKSNKGEENNVNNDNNTVLIRKRNVPHDDNAPTNASPNESTTATATATTTPDTDIGSSSKSNKGDEHNDNDNDDDNVLISKRNVPDDHHTPTNDSPPRSTTTPTTPTPTPTQRTIKKVRVQPEVEQHPPPRDDFALILENYIMYKQLLRKKRSLRNRLLQLARHDNINIDSGNEKTPQDNKKFDGGNDIDDGIITANKQNHNDIGFDFDFNNNLNRNVKDEEERESRRRGLVFPPFIHHHHQAMPPFVANEFNRKHHVLTLKDIKRVFEGHHDQQNENKKNDMNMNMNTGSIPPTPVPHVVPWSSPMYWMWHPSVFNNRPNDRQALMHLLMANSDPIQAIKDMMTRRLANRRNRPSTTSTGADTATRLVKQNIMEKNHHHLNNIHNNNNNHEHNDDMINRDESESSDINNINNDVNVGSDVNADDNNDDFAFQMILSSDSNSNSNPISSNRNNLNNINSDSDSERNNNDEEVAKDGSSVFMLKLNDMAIPFGGSSGSSGVGSLDHHRHAPFHGFLGQLISSIVNQNLNNDNKKNMKNFIRDMVKKNFHNIIYGKKNKKNKSNETHHKHSDNSGKGHHNHNPNHNHSKSKSGHDLKSTNNHQHHNKGNEHTDDEINRDKKLHNNDNDNTDKNHHTDRQIVHHHNKLDGEKDHNKPEAEVHPTRSNDGIAIQNSKEMITVNSQTHSNKTEPPKQRSHRDELTTIASIKQYFNSNNENDNNTNISKGGYNFKVDKNSNNKDDENKNNEKNKIDNIMVNRNYSTLKPNSSTKVSDTQQNTELNLVQKIINDLNEVDVKVKGEATHQPISENDHNVENSKYSFIKENNVNDFKNNNLNHDNIIDEKEGHENKKKNTTQEIVDDVGKILDNKKNTVKQMNIKKEKEQKQTNKMLFNINSSDQKHNVLFENDKKFDLEKEFPGAKIEEPISQRDLTQGHNDNDNVEDFKQRITQQNKNIEQVHQNILLNQAVKRMKNELRKDIGVDKTIPEVPQQYPFMNSMAFENENENENSNENNMGRRRGPSVGEDEIMDGDYFLPPDNVNNDHLKKYDIRSNLKKEKEHKATEHQDHEHNNRFYKLSRHQEESVYPHEDQESLKLKREFADSEEARIAPETQHQQLLNFNQDNNNNNNNNNNMFISKTRRSMRLRRSSDASSSSSSSSNHEGIHNSEHISNHHNTPSSHSNSDSKNHHEGNAKSKVDDHKNSLNGNDVAMLLIKPFPNFNNDDNNKDNNNKDNNQPLKNSIEHSSESQESDNNVHHNTKGEEVINKKKGDQTLSDTATDSDDRIPFIPSLDGVMRNNDDNSGSSSGS